MKTIVETRRGRDFSGRNLGTIITEPQIIVPQDGLLAAFRTKVSLVGSQVYAGAWAGSMGEIDGGPIYSRTSARSGGGLQDYGGLALLNQRTSAGSSSFVAVYWQEQRSATSSLLGRIVGAAAVKRGLCYLSGGGGYAMVSGTQGEGFFSATLPPAGLNRWEMLAGVADADSGEVRLYRPRTGDVAVAECSNFDDVNSAIRVWGDSSISGGGFEGAWGCIHDRVLSETEIQNVYLSAQASLITSQILI